MGVPKFFRSISERYPCLSELVNEFQIPDFDNLYLDMNGIIHVCSHPDDFDPHFSITEEKIFSSIFYYIEILFNMIKPRKLFFMAVDGVAPRAKMNQQRARRFRSAKEAEMRDKEAMEKGEKPLLTNRFDSNCITPGTVFMDRLHAQLKYFITSKISTDPLWQACKVILSGHQTPGEGEHKIMDYIRYLKTLPDYDENTRHCLYGLDADLIMLGLCTHEPHFSLLREKVRFKKQESKRMASPHETEFYLLHLSLLREYLDLEFQDLKESLPFEYNLENIIDDWVLMGFMVGNDFIPNLPDLHINKGAFPILYKAYKDVLPTLDGYLNENGYLNLPRFEKYMEKLAEHDLETFEDTFANLAFLEEKMGKSSLAEKEENAVSGRKPELENLIKATDDFLEMSEDEYTDEEADENADSDLFMWEFCQHKKHYYTNKLECSKVTPELLKSQAEGYVRAIQWNLHYYYQGCQSWSWFYPHHYAPYISDIKDFKDLKLDFEMGKPFLPFQQLLAVLPAASKNLLPKPYHELMTSPNSPIKDFYPEDFETDLNGKQHDWEAVVLIPFIDEKRLLEAMKPCEEKLTAEEKRRNEHGPMHVFSYTKEDLGIYKALEYFPTVPSNHALMVDVFREELIVKNSALKYGLRPGVLLGVLYPGFPTLKHIPHTGHLKASKVRVFEQPSRGENMILTLKKREYPDIDVLANNLLGKIIYVNWPHLVESKAIAISNKDVRYYISEEARIECEVLDEQKQMQFFRDGEGIARHCAEKMGIDIGPIDFIVYVLMLDGRKYLFKHRSRIISQRIWSTTSSPFPIQATVEGLKIVDHRCRSYTDLKEAFPVDSVVFMLGQPHFGSMGRILDSTDCLNNGRLKVELEIIVDPVIHDSIAKSESEVSYLPCRIAALKVGISPRLLSRITGTVLVSMTKEERLDNPGSKINIGLKLKFFMKNEEIPGYTKREKDSWLFSFKAVRLVAAYVEKFSRVVEYLSSNLDRNVFFVEEIFPAPGGLTEMKEMVAWINAQEYSKIERSKCGTNVLDPQVVAKIEKIVDRTPKHRLTKHMQVRPNLLYKSDLVFGNVPPVESAKHALLDRVVSIRSSSTVPVGLRGFIIGIHPAPLEADYTYDVLFDESFVGGTKLNSSSERTFRMSRASFLNITDANRQYHKANPAFFDRQSYKATPAFFGSAPGNNVSLRPDYEKVSAFAQWNHRPPRPVNQPVNEEFQKGSAPANNVSLRPDYEKVSAFAEWNHGPPRPVNQAVNEEFQKIWSNLQTAKPQEDALKKLLKIEKEKKAEIEDAVKSFFEKVTKASNGNPEKPENPSGLLIESNEPRNRFYLQLFSYYQKRGLGQPRFKYLKVGGKVMAQVFFADGAVYSGLLYDDEESACESASLQALAALKEIPFSNETLLQMDLEREKRLKERPVKVPSGSQRSKGPDVANHRHMPPLLPNPPSQWVGLSKGAHAQQLPFYPPRDSFQIRQAKDIPEKPNNSSHAKSKKLNASALEFVPLQAIRGKRTIKKIPTIQSPKPVVESQRKTEVVATFTSPKSASSTVKPRRKPKIAANLNLDPNLN